MAKAVNSRQAVSKGSGHLTAYLKAHYLPFVREALMCAERAEGLSKRMLNTALF